MHILCVYSRTRETLLESGWKWTVTGPFFQDGLRFRQMISVRVLSQAANLLLIVYAFTHTFTKETRQLQGACELTGLG